MNNSMLISHEPFLMQTHAPSYVEVETLRSSFPASAHVQLPMVQTCKIPASDDPFARSLTVREIEILELLGKGLSVKGAARDLAISPGTVKWHVKNLYEKLGASSREDALHKARLRQLIS